MFLVFDTSLSMKARSAPDAPTRLTRAKQEAKALIPHLGDLPVGIATMTDRVLPNLMPTPTVRARAEDGEASRCGSTSRRRACATTAGRRRWSRSSRSSSDRLFPPGVKHPMLVVFTDGEMKAPPPFTGYSFAQQVTIPPLFVHVWTPTERTSTWTGQVDPAYQPDPTSARSSPISPP